MKGPSPDLPSLVAGLAITGFGGLLMADAAGAIELGFEWLAPAVLATVGAVLLALGLGRDA